LMYRLLNALFIALLNQNRQALDEKSPVKPG